MNNDDSERSPLSDNHPSSADPLPEAKGNAASAEFAAPDAFPSAHGIEPAPDYEIIRRIGEGAYGEVYLARDSGGTYRAIKVVFRATFEHDRPYEREYEGISKFERISRSYDNQVQVFHVGRREEPRQFYYIMELADDQQRGQDIVPESYEPKTLRSELQSRGRLPVKECIEIGVALARALHNLHENGLIHRDIKPANIIFVNGRAKLADIGLVTDRDMSVSFVGTDGYIPPEGPSSPRADIYGLGKLLYEICTGRGRLDYPELPTDLAEQPDRELILELSEIISKACESNPVKRYKSAVQMLSDLKCLHQGQSLRRRRHLHRRFVRMGLTAGIAVFTAGSIWLWPRLRPAIAQSSTAHLGTDSTPPPVVGNRVLTNSLGMIFVQVLNTQPLFCIWETRVRDFTTFTQATAYQATTRVVRPEGGFVPKGSWSNPGFAQSPDHPVCGVNFEDAQAFCRWLTEVEGRMGGITANQRYRLPTDLEWSRAIRLPVETGSTPSARSASSRDLFPWGKTWPPPHAVANYAGEESGLHDPLARYHDGYPRTAPVGSFPPNDFGLYDLGGNVSELCEDWLDEQQNRRVNRGTSWDAAQPDQIASSCRFGLPKGLASTSIGFRVVLVAND